jgi:hypothetical protein
MRERLPVDVVLFLMYMYTEREAFVMYMYTERERLL